MNFRIANTFTNRLAKLNGEEQKSIKATHVRWVENE